MNIIAKKIRGFYGNKNGLIRPLFEFDTLEELTPIAPTDYPNNGCIFVADYDLLHNNDVRSDLFIMENCFFIGDGIYPDRQYDHNSSQKRINYNSRLSNYFKPLTPTRLIPIYDNTFDLNSNRLNNTNTENITSQIFFLSDSSSKHVYGPFERDNLDLKAANFQNLDEDLYPEDLDDFTKDFLELYSDFDGALIYKVSDDEIENLIIADNQGNKYLLDFADFFEKNIGHQIEFTPISVLHKWALDKFGQRSTNLKDALLEIKQLDVQPSSVIDKLRWERYINILEKINDDDKVLDNIVTVLFQRGFINNINESQELENTKKDLLEANENIKVKNDEIIKLKDEREALDLQLKETRERNVGDIDASIFPNLSRIFAETESLQKLEDYVTVIELKDSLTNEIQRLEVKKEFIIEEITKKEETKRQVEASVKLIKQNFDHDVAVHTAKLGEAKMYTDLLNGINITPNEFEKKSSPEKLNISELPGDITTAKGYINEVQRRLKAIGRELTFNEVANLIITTNQSFLTIIAGAPGVGKTSIVEKLAKSYGLSQNNGGYLEINCARGWTSSKDLIGFYNPLTGRYQQSKTRLKEALETSSANPNAPYIVLLDEANLSPIEHYWSDFIKLADRDYARTIKISDKEVINFGDGFRFIATINHDHTTEALSNRLLDRAAIIQIEKSNHISEEVLDSVKYEHIFGFADIQKLFNETQKWKSDEELIKKFLYQLKEKVESNNSGIVISPRKELAIRRFCRVATGLLEGNSYTALDYAVAQHIIPLINGRGEQFENNLKAIKNDLNDKGMLKSEKLLAKILDRGKDMKHFKYIYY